MTCLQSLQKQVDALRADIQDWDDHVAGRKHVFQTYEEMNEMSKTTTAVVKPTPARPSETPAGSWTAGTEARRAKLCAVKNGLA
jgi:hypothetical protein